MLAFIVNTFPIKCIPDRKSVLWYLSWFRICLDSVGFSSLQLLLFSHYYKRKIIMLLVQRWWWGNVEKSPVWYCYARFAVPDFAVGKCKNHKCKVFHFFIVWKFVSTIKHFYCCQLLEKVCTFTLPHVHHHL